MYQRDRDKMDLRGQIRDRQPVDRAEYERLVVKVEALTREVRCFMAKDQAPDSDGWITWPGGEQPVSDDTEVEVCFRGGGGTLINTRVDWATHFVWSHSGGAFDIIAYRPAKQEAEWPQKGDEYWCIDASGDVNKMLWSDDEFDAHYHAFLGSYHTRDAAEDAAAKIRRVMEHLRNGCTVTLDSEDDVYRSERIEL